MSASVRANAPVHEPVAYCIDQAVELMKEKRIERSRTLIHDVAGANLNALC